MGLLDLFMKKDKKPEAPQNTPVPRQKTTTQPAKKSTTPNSEKKYYQPDSYYTEKTHEGTVFGQAVITFEKRKSTCIPSRNGLYVAEILLLEYCSYGTYPGPKNGYPGIWWFMYGIRDVGKLLRSLEERGYIQFASGKDSVSKLTIAQLNEILAQHDLSTSGKKADLVERVVSNVSEENLLGLGIERKYKLTDAGKQELKENEYVPYMHKHPHTTTEDDKFGPAFNVWSINKILGSGNKSNWREIVDSEENKKDDHTERKNKAFMADLKKIDLEGYETLKRQDDQLAAIQKAEAKYESDKDLDALIIFWENIWANDGLKFEGSHWHFRLPDLYIMAKRFDDAFVIVQRSKKTKKNYTPDSRSLQTILTDLQQAGFDDIILVTDRGYESLRNLENYIAKGQAMVMCTKVQQKHVLDKILGFGEFNSRPDGMEIDRDTRLYYRQYDIVHDVEGHSGSTKKSDRLRLNIYFDSMRRSEELVNLEIELMTQKEALDEMISAKAVLDDDITVKKAYCYYEISYDPATRIILSYKENEKKIAKAKRLSGFFAIMTHKLDLTAMETFRIYRLRDEQEKYFQQMKSQMVCDKQRNWSEEGKTGRLFILFIGLILSSYVRHVWKTTVLKDQFSSSLEVLDEMRPIRCIEHSGKAKFITPFVGAQIDICRAFQFSIPPECAPDYVSKQKLIKRRSRPKRKTTEWDF